MKHDSTSQKSLEILIAMDENRPAKKTGSLYDRLNYDLQHDPKVQEEVALGKRVGLYRIKQTKLGAGNFAVVKLGVHLLTSEKVAMKIIDKTKLEEQSRRLLSNEVTCMEQLYHPHIVRLYEVIDTFSKLYLVMEVAGNGCLVDRIIRNGKFTEHGARDIFSQVAGAVRYMHNHGIVHRDLKAENVLFSNNQVKICDFGFSVKAKSSQPLDLFCGSPPYAAPELFCEKSYLGPPVDVWAIGVILYYMITGMQPFSADSIPELKKKVILAEFYMPQSVTTALQRLLAGMLNKVVEERMTLNDVAACEWMQVNGMSAMTEASYSDGDKSCQVLDELSSLGVPSLDNEQLSSEPRSPAVGAYHIVLHKKLVKQACKEEEEENRHIVQRKEGGGRLKKQTSRLCIIL